MKTSTSSDLLAYFRTLPTCEDHVDATGVLLLCTHTKPHNTYSILDAKSLQKLITTTAMGNYHEKREKNIYHINIYIYHMYTTRRAKYQHSTLHPLRYVVCVDECASIFAEQPRFKLKLLQASEPHSTSLHRNSVS